MSTPSTSENNIVVLFRSFDELAQEQHEIEAQYHIDWHKAYAVYDRTIAALEGDDTALAKFEAPEIALAKAEAARLKSENWRISLAKMDVVRKLAETLVALTDARNERLYGFNALVKRSVRFAAAQERRHYGAGAGSLPQN